MLFGVGTAYAPRDTPNALLAWYDNNSCFLCGGDYCAFIQAAKSQRSGFAPGGTVQGYADFDRAVSNIV